MTKQEMIDRFVKMLTEAKAIEHAVNQFEHHAFEFQFDGEVSFWLVEGKDGKLFWS